MLEPKGKIQSTLESTKQRTSRIVTIFIPLVSFLNLLAKYITFKIAKGCSYQDISTASKYAPLKAQPSFSLSNFGTHLSIFSLFKKHSIKTCRKYLRFSKGKCVNFIY